jgi:hypothetical protein
MHGIYVKLPSGIWIRIKGKIGRIISSKTRGKQGISYTLLGESLDDEPIISDEPVMKYYISSTRVTKYIVKLLDETKTRKYILLIKPVTKETYEVIIYGDREEAVKTYTLAEELKILKKPPKKAMRV